MQMYKYYIFWFILALFLKIRIFLCLKAAYKGEKNCMIAGDLGYPEQAGVSISVDWDEVNFFCCFAKI